MTVNAGSNAYPKALVITGPTASGKSALSLRLARLLGGSIVNLDSVQIYKGFDVGSAKPTVEQRQSAEHLLFDLTAWHEDMDAAKYSEIAKKTWLHSKVPLVFTGGTGLYLRSLWGQNFHEQEASDPEVKKQLQQKVQAGELAVLYEELKKVDPLRAEVLHPNDHVRIVRALEIFRSTGMRFAQFTSDKQGGPSHELRSRCYWVHLNPDRELLRQQIKQRTKEMVEHGRLWQEVLQLLRSGVSSTCKPMRTIGYKQVIACLRGELTPSELEERIFFATCQYAKRQRTWFAKTSPDICVELFGSEVCLDSIEPDIQNFLGSGT